MLGRLSHADIEEVLYNNVMGRIGCSDGERNYIVPISYIYDGQYIIAHSISGMKIDMMRKNPNVCFEVDEIKDHTNWRSVIVWGSYEELEDEREKQEAMKLFVNKTMRLKISETAILPERTEKRVHPRSPGFIKPIIYRIHVTEKTGRFENSDNI